MAITSYSSSGPGSESALGNTTKPDIAAVGGDLYGTVISADTTFDDGVNVYLDYSWYRGDYYPLRFIRFSDRCPYDLAVFQGPAIFRGTSTAASHVAGAVALLISALYGGWANWPKTAAAAAQIKAILCATAWEIDVKNRGGKDPVEGFGLLQIDAVVDVATKEYTIGTYVAEGLFPDPFSRHVWARKVYLTAGRTYTFELAVPGTGDFDIWG